MKHWPASPQEVTQAVERWETMYPDLVTVERREQYAGTTLFAVTIGAGSEKKLLFSQPHAHEPATTVGMLSVMSELLDGSDLVGDASTPEQKKRREKIKSTMTLTFIPDGNPDGRSRAPMHYYDGSKISNAEFGCIMRGRDPVTGEMWKRLDRWTTEEQLNHPDPIGIVYEQLAQNEYCEPNRCSDSTFMKLAAHLFEMYDYTAWVDLHQTEMEHEPENCFVVLPWLFDELSSELQRTNRQLAEAIVESWADSDGARPIHKIAPLGYTGAEGGFFRDVWGPYHRRIPQVNVEVQNNNTRTHPRLQAELIASSIRSSITHFLKE